MITDTQKMLIPNRRSLLALGMYLVLPNKGLVVQSFSNNQAATISTYRPTATTFTTELYGALSRASIIKASSSSKRQHSFPSDPTLPEIIEEALARQRRILDNLQQEAGKSQSMTIMTIRDYHVSANERTKLNEKNERRKLVVQDRIRCVESITSNLTSMLLDVQSDDTNTMTLSDKRKASIKLKLEALGFQSLLEPNQSTDQWLTVREVVQEYGRPSGFQGLVFYSPRHQVPILVGKMRCHADETLRRVAQGSDLWFQVEDYEGSRVLLRTSLFRGLRDSKTCMQRAADLAAYYSHHRHDTGGVNVMYTDSKHVAKRGSKVGQMRKSKRLGQIIGHPSDVCDIARDREPS